MSTRWEWLVGTRYLRSAHRRGFVSFVAAISVIGLMLGVATLIVVLSVMNGFERELRSRILSVTSHATLMGLEGTLPDWQAARERALATSGVTHAVPYIEAQAMIAHGSRVLGTAIRGVDPALEREATGLAAHLRDARIEDLEPGRWRVVLGAALAAELGVRKGDTVVLIAPEGSATPEGVMPRMRRLTVAGTFESGMYEFDRGLVLLNLRDAARLYRMGEEVSGLRLALTDPLQAPQMVRDLALSLGVGSTSATGRATTPTFPIDRVDQGADVRDPAHHRGCGRLQHRCDAGHDRQGKAGRYRLVAYAWSVAGQHPCNFCGAGCADWSGGHGFGRGARHYAGAKRGEHRA